MSPFYWDFKYLCDFHSISYKINLSPLHPKILPHNFSPSWEIEILFPRKDTFWYFKGYIHFIRKFNTNQSHLSFGYINNAQNCRPFCRNSGHLKRKSFIHLSSEYLIWTCLVLKFHVVVSIFLLTNCTDKCCSLILCNAGIEADSKQIRIIYKKLFLSAHATLSKWQNILSSFQWPSSSPHYACIFWLSTSCTI